MPNEATETSTTTEAAAETSGDSTEAAATEATETSAEESSTDGEKALGDAGKKALDAMKQARNDAKAEAKKAADELAALRAQVEGREAEHKAEQAQRETERAALEKANDRILRSEVKAAAKGVLADPADAYKFLDLDSFEVSEDGEVNDDAIAEALAELTKNKPYLAVQDGKRFQGDADAGTRKESRPAQWSQSDVDKATPEQIVEAKQKGHLNDLLGIR